MFAPADVRLLPGQPLAFRCRCARTRCEHALRLLGRDEVEAALAQVGAVMMTCEFCGRRYDFDATEARALFAPG